MKNISLLSMKISFQKTEPLVFYFIVFLHCLPVLLLKFFITHDGPAHVYNAVLIKSLLFGEDALANNFYLLRSFPEPNWIGHAGMVLMSFVMSPVTAERILLLSYIILLPVLFRRLIRLTNSGSPLLSYLIIPFIYSYVFYGGLYNFMLGIPLLLFALLFLLNRKLPLRKMDFLFVFFTGLLIYFSHLLIFGIYLLLIPIVFFIQHQCQAKIISGVITASKKSLIKNILLSLLMLLPGLALSAKFIFEKASLHSVSMPANFWNLFYDLAIVNPVIALTDSGEVKHGIALGVVMLLLFAGAVFSRWKNRSTGISPIPGPHNHSIFWLTASILMLVFYFVIPDDFATGGVVKVRFSYFFFLFGILWLASQKIPSVVIRYSTAAVILLSLVRLFHFSNSSRQLSHDAEVFYSASELIEPNSIVLPLNYSTNWMHSNISNYLGTYNHSIVLDNYEAGREHFPLTWNENRNPVVLMGSFNGLPPLCANVFEFEKNTSGKIDYIILWRYQTIMTDTCTQQIQSILRSNYSLCFKSLDRQLYMYKRND